jgi:hypothetical protein
MVLLLTLECCKLHISEGSHGTDLFNDSVRSHEVIYGNVAK